MEINLAQFIGFEKDQNIYLSFPLLVLLLTSPILLKQQIKKEKYITKIDPHLNYQDTYCKPFLKKVQLIKYLLISVMLGLSISFFLGIYTQFQPINSIYIQKLIIIPFSISQQIQTFIVFNQLVEYFAIFYLVFTQKKRDINEILFDFNHEPMNQKISKGQIWFRRYELKCVKFFKFIKVLIIIISFGISCAIAIYESTQILKRTEINPHNVLQIFNLILLVFCFLFLCILIFSLYRHHRFEFQRLKANLFIEIIFYMIILLIPNLQIVYYKNSDLNDNFIWKIYYFTQFVLQMDSNIVMYYIILLQSSKDILQGVNKLDYYLKVSAFQSYKNKKLENRKSSFQTHKFQDQKNQELNNEIQKTESYLLQGQVYENMGRTQNYDNTLN